MDKNRLGMPKVHYREDTANTANPYAIYTKAVIVNGEAVLTDPEGYILDLDAWSEGFALAQAAVEGLTLTDEHWAVIWFIRQHHEERGVQAQVRDMIRHFREIWEPERGNNHYLHDLFPMGGPQKQGNRIAGIRKTKGEH